MVTVIEWGRVPGTNVDAASYGRYTVFLRRRSTGTWAVELYHSGRRTRHQELPASYSSADARQEAESWLLDEQGPQIRELARRVRAAQLETAGTRSMRAAGKRKQVKRGRRAPTGVTEKQFAAWMKARRIGR